MQHFQIWEFLEWETTVYFWTFKNPIVHLLIAANSISSARRRKQRRAVPELHPSSSSSYTLTYSALVTMVFDGCAPLVWRWNGYVPWPKSSPHNTLKMSEVFNNQFELLKMLTIKVPGNTWTWIERLHWKLRSNFRSIGISVLSPPIMVKDKYKVYCICAVLSQI